MTSASLDILAIGDALVDVIATAEDSSVDEHGLPKGGMQLIRPSRPTVFIRRWDRRAKSAAVRRRTAWRAPPRLGLDVAFVGQVADDQLGDIFAHDMRSLGVRFETPPLTAPPPTGRCLIVVTPDGQRTMNTCPGASHQLRPDALDEAMIASASILMLEGYLWGRSCRAGRLCARSRSRERLAQR